MKFCILMGSPRLHGNTAELLKPFIAELEKNECSVIYIPLSEKKILPCIECNACQQVNGRYGCIQQDDVAEIMDCIIDNDCIVLATPIFTWFCTAPMKALLDRHYGLNKYYGKAKGSLWAGKNISIIATHGYETEAAEPFETSIERLCKHSHLNYLGMFSVRDTDYTEEDYLASFQTPSAREGAANFALQLIKKIQEDC